VPKYGGALSTYAGLTIPFSRVLVSPGRPLAGAQSV